MCDGGNRRQQYQKEWIRAKRARIRARNLFNIQDDSTSSDCSEVADDERAGCFSDQNQNEPPTAHVDVIDTATSLETVPAYETCTDGSVISSHMKCSDKPISTGSESDSDAGFESQVRWRLVEWATECNVPQRTTDLLLRHLREAGLEGLPRTARSLQSSARDIGLQDVSSMQYYYLGLIPEIKTLISNLPRSVMEDVKTLELVLNIDGLPLFESSKTVFWPILCCVINVAPKVVFPVAITCGNSKPENLEFLQDTVNDLRILLSNGLASEGKMYLVKLTCIVCDAPARSMVKATKQYSGYSGCDKCAQMGEYVDHRMTYPDIYQLDFRTNMSFREQSDSEHHKGHSPFCDLPINMIDTFSVDYMHCVCLGVTKRLIKMWTTSNGISRGVRMSSSQVTEVSKRLEEMKPFIPKIFSRKPRSLIHFDKFKATELRLLLLYIGKIALKGILRTDLYKHFLLLNQAMCILISGNVNVERADLCQRLLEKFVKDGSELYGRTFLVYNVHALLHLPQDALVFRSLDYCSAFRFENYMQTLLRMVRSGKNPLSQVIRRYKESMKTLNSKLSRQSHELRRTALSASRPNNGFLMKDGSCCEVTQIINGRCDHYEIMCNVFTSRKPLYTSPVNSNAIGAFKCCMSGVRSIRASSKDLANRAILLEYPNGEIVFLTILHNFATEQ